MGVKTHPTYFPEVMTPTRQDLRPGVTVSLMLTPELSVGWVDPRVGLDWVGSEMGRKFVF